MTQQPEHSRTRRAGEGARKGGFARFRPSPGRSDSFLATSLELFAERNFASVTIKDIAQALDVNPALIYYYFDSKTDLFRATIERAVVRAFENIRALEDKSADPATILAAWLANHVNKYHEIHRFVKIALDFRSSHEGDQAIAEAIEAFYVEERRILSKVIRDGVRQRPVQTRQPRAPRAVHIDPSRRLHGAIGHPDRFRSQGRGAGPASSCPGHAGLCAGEAKEIAAARSMTRKA